MDENQHNDNLTAAGDSKENPAPAAQQSEEPQDSLKQASAGETGKEKSAQHGKSEMKEVQAKTVDMKKRKRGNRLGFVLTIIIFVCVVIVLWNVGNLLRGGNNATFIDLVSGMNGWYIFAVFGILLCMFVCEVLKFTLLNKTFGCSIGIKRDIKLALTGKYYEAITPTATGGQPMQILYLHSRGVSGGKASSVVMMKYTVQMLAAAIVGAIVMGVWGNLLFRVIDDGTVTMGVYVGGWVGFAINACAPVFVTVIIFCPEILKKLVHLGLVILRKMHIVKKFDERRARIFRAIDDFSVCSQFIFKHPLKFFQLFGLCVVEPVCANAIPYFVLTALCGSYVADVPDLFFTVLALSTFATYAVVYIPTPGNSGAFETVFMLAFATISGDAMFWVAIVCRFFTYYIYIVLGIGMNLVDIIRNFVGKKRSAGAGGDK